MTKEKFDDIIISNGLKIDPEKPEMVMMPGISNWAFRYYKNGSEIWSAAKILYDDNKYHFSSWEKNNIEDVKSLISKIKEFQETYKKLRKEHRLKMIKEL